MKKILLGLVAGLALTSFAVKAIADEGGDAPKKEAKKGKKAPKKDEKKEEAK